MSADEALTFGLVDEVVPGRKTIAPPSRKAKDASSDDKADKADKADKKRGPSSKSTPRS